MSDDSGKSDDSLPALFKNADGRYQQASGVASGLVRTLAVSAVGVVWLFGGGLDSVTGDAPQGVLDAVRSSSAFATALITALAALALDLLQYAYSAAMWGGYKWALGKLILASQRPADREAAPRWAVVWLARQLQLDLYLIPEDARSADDAEMWRALVVAVRDADGANREKLGQPWFAGTLGRPVSLLFGAKLISLVVCYAFLIVALY